MDGETGFTNPNHHNKGNRSHESGISYRFHGVSEPVWLASRHFVSRNGNVALKTNRVFEPREPVGASPSLSLQYESIVCVPSYCPFVWEEEKWPNMYMICEYLSLQRNISSSEVVTALSHPIKLDVAVSSTNLWRE
ncbi:uncharacterized protein PHALS_07268 [Plasmopara halstedii]|uniref:Uncharacterized protein n=1 Tax=Plasmopara halstedii TaxID=4781 RepID=A0A0P1B414_PLAHL|nr:uncharacterized protein PHALS_07268 [Plasmopara halstedii]CEG49508.1 hypothetical protein PHALS_07268 [Plasmopara halstedii]|eukprot:XP_024585877.1 hypothetical protein PHALS_07268 [Plasmopara halstedii]